MVIERFTATPGGGHPPVLKLMNQARCGSGYAPPRSGPTLPSDTRTPLIPPVLLISGWPRPRVSIVTRHFGAVRVVGKGSHHPFWCCWTRSAEMACAAVRDGDRGTSRGLWLHPGVLQHPPAPLGAWLRVAGEFRETQPCGLKRTCGARAAEAFRASPARSFHRGRSSPLPTPGGGRKETTSDTLNPKN